jgi:hypothetical protein
MKCRKNLVIRHPDPRRRLQKKQGAAYNFLSALTFLVGAIIAYGASFAYDVTFLLPPATSSTSRPPTLSRRSSSTKMPQVNIVHFLVLGRFRAALGSRTDLRLRAPGRHLFIPILLRAE